MSWNDFFGGGDTTLPWADLTDLNQISEIVEASKTQPQLIFKHSTRCSISRMAKSRFEREWNLDDQVKPWYLNLLAYRDVSNAVADQLEVDHQSPQAILIIDGKVDYQATHSSISAWDIEENLKNLKS